MNITVNKTFESEIQRTKRKLHWFNYIIKSRIIYIYEYTLSLNIINNSYVIKNYKELINKLKNGKITAIDISENKTDNVIYLNMYIKFVNHGTINLVFNKNVFYLENKNELHESLKIIAQNMCAER